PAPVPMPAWTDSEVVRPLAISSPPASPLSPWASPPPQIPFPPLPPILSPPSHVERGFYGITDSWDEIVETLQGAPVSTDTELGRYVRKFETRVRHDTDEIYMRLDDEQTERQQLAGQLNMRSTEISELRTTLQGQVTALQGQVTALQAQVTTLQGQQGLAGSPTQSELPEEAGGSA
nr:hypothetical protein [Tanacetum cinerariifolium]